MMIFRGFAGTQGEVLTQLEQDEMENGPQAATWEPWVNFDYSSVRMDFELPAWKRLQLPSRETVLAAIDKRPLAPVSVGCGRNPETQSPEVSECFITKDKQGVKVIIRNPDGSLDYQVWKIQPNPTLKRWDVSVRQ